MEPVKGAKIYVNGIKLKAKQELGHLVTKNCYSKVSLLVIVTKTTYCLINEGEVENPIQSFYIYFLCEQILNFTEQNKVWVQLLVFVCGASSGEESK